MKVKTSETFFPLVGTLLFLFLLLPFFIVWIPHQIIGSPEHMYSFEIGDGRYFGLVLIPLGILLYLWCAINFVFAGKGTPIPFTPTKQLIVTGPYRWVRNPMYIAGVFVLLGESLLFQSIGIFIYCLVLFVLFNVQVFIEETMLADQFGSVYDQYRKHVPRWIPRRKPYRGSVPKH